MSKNYGYPATLSEGAVGVALSWLGLGEDRRTEVEVLAAEGCGWGAIRRQLHVISNVKEKPNVAIKIKVSNFRGIRLAEFSCAPVAICAGLNSAGKSSIANAVAACLTGRAIEDSFELRKSDIGQLVRDGATVATVDIATDTGTAQMKYPDAKLSTTGDAPRATPFAVGLLSIPTMPLKERAAALAPYMKADPNLDDLLAALRDEFDEETITRCWEVLKRDGWDTTLKGLEEKRARARASWEQIAGESFGSSKAKVWCPDGWADDLFGEATIEQLEQRRAEAQAAVERSVGTVAVEASELDKLRAVAGEVEARLLAVDEAKNAVEALGHEKAQVDQRFFAAPVPQNFAPLECPHCQGKIRFRSVPNTPNGCTIEKAEPIGEEENTRRRHVIAELDGARANVASRLAAAQRALTVAEERLNEATAAAEKVVGAEAGDESAAEAAEAARAALRQADTDLIRFKRKTEAEAAYQRWEANDKFAAVLSNGPQGLRAKKLSEATLLFNSQILAPLCNAAGWGKVEITEDFRVTLGGRVYPLLSDSDQLRVRAILQVAMAKIDGSSMVIIDRAEALDAENKKKLISLLIDCGVPSLVAMVVPKPSMVPDLAKAGYGSTLWVDGGEAKPLAAVA
jgi:hypothetical protein